MKYNINFFALLVLAGSQLVAEPLSIEGKQEIVTQSSSSDAAAEAAKKLANPIANMISLPIQVNYQQNLGWDDKGDKWLTNVQPVIPIEINDEWNLISRTILPLVSEDNGLNTTSGVADIVQSAWLSPKAPTESGWIWGAGAAFLIPTGSDLSAEKWGVGPTFIALKQSGPWTYGGLTNHLWSFAGDDIKDVNGNVLNNVNQTFMQPFLTYITPEAVTFSLNTESIYDWERDQWTIPLNLSVTKVTKIGNQLISYGGGVTYWAEAPDNGPEGWGARFILTFIFPK